MKRKITSLLLSVVFVLLAVFALHDNRVVEAADSVVLLEKRHPIYWEYLRPENGKTRYMASNGNLLYSDIQNKTIGKSLVLSVDGDRIITLDGQNDSNKPIYIWLANLSLPVGKYFLTSGTSTTENISIYLWSKDLGEVIAYGNNTEFETVNSNALQVGITVPPGAYLNDVKVMPMISTEANSVYIPFQRTSECYKALIYNIKSIDNLNQSDLKIFLHSINKENFDWNSIIDEKNNGIQWSEKDNNRGILDELGRPIGQ